MFPQDLLQEQLLQEELLQRQMETENRQKGPGFIDQSLRNRSLRKDGGVGGVDLVNKGIVMNTNILVKSEHVEDGVDKLETNANGVNVRASSEKNSDGINPESRDGKPGDANASNSDLGPTGRRGAAGQGPNSVNAPPALRTGYSARQAARTGENSLIAFRTGCAVRQAARTGEELSVSSNSVWKTLKY
jgi:hypothetical protein